MKVVTVIPLKKGFFKDHLTYFTSKDIPEGNVVEILIRGKKWLGLAVASEEASTLKVGLKGMTFKLQKISEDKGPSMWRREFMDTVSETSRYFACTKSALFTLMIPAVYRENYDSLSKFFPKKDAKKKLPETGKTRPEKLLFQAPEEDRLFFYKNLVRGSFADKKSVFIALPTERDIDVFSEKLGKGIERFTFCLHGGLSPKKLLELCGKIAGEQHPILALGTVPFLSVPLPNLGTIIVERESSPAYKALRRPYADFRIFAEVFASKIGAKFILADSLLRFESIARKETDGWSEAAPLSFRPDFDGQIIISGKKDGRDQGEKFKALRPESLELIRQTLSKGKNVFVFSLRKGLATYTVCRDCGEVLLCDKCLCPVVLYTSKKGNRRMFVCNRCHLEKSPDTTCPNCASWNLLPLGIGAESVYEELKEVFSGEKRRTPILRLDKESAKTDRQAKKIVRELEEYSGAILVGTELALFYLEEKAPLSVIASFDSLWSIPSFRMSERVAELLMSIISNTSETVMIETRNENDPEIQSIKNGTLGQFIKSELEERKNLGYPPYRRFIKITFSGSKEKTSAARKTLSDLLVGYQPEIFSGFVPKIKDKYITNALIKLRPENWSLPELLPDASIDQNLFSRLLSLPSDFSVNVDPEDLL